MAPRRTPIAQSAAQGQKETHPQSPGKNSTQENPQEIRSFFRREKNSRGHANA